MNNITVNYKSQVTDASVDFISTFVGPATHRIDRVFNNEHALLLNGEESVLVSSSSLIALRDLLVQYIDSVQKEKA